jgi:hypothetical protein
VFTTGIRAYQLVTYLDLVRERYGHGVANQIDIYQQRLLEREAGGNIITHSIKLVNDALDTDTVVADTVHGSIDIPIEMNIALSLLLGAASSPHYARHPDQWSTEIGNMDLDIDWLLSHCLTRARDEMRNVFAPLLACVDSGVRMEFAQAYLSGRLVAG